MKQVPQQEKPLQAVLEPEPAQPCPLQEKTDKANQNLQKELLLRPTEHLFRQQEILQALVLNLHANVSFGVLFLARPAGFEPATCGLEIRCSIQLG